MKELTEYFVGKNTIFKTISEVLPKELGSRKKIEIFSAVGVDLNYYAIFIVDGKSRFLKKNADDLMQLCSKLIDLQDHNFKRKILLISSPLCSKAKMYLKDHGWKVSSDYR